MKSKKPFFSKELIVNNLKRFWWIAVLYTIALFLVSPLITLTNHFYTVSSSGYNIVFSDIFNGTIVFLFTVPVFIAVMMFRYMQNPKSMVTMHAMPYTRLGLYVNNIISGLILLTIPLLLNSAFLSIIQLGNFGGTYFREGIVLKYLGISLLTSCTLYSWTIFIGMFTGSSIAQIIFTYISNLLVAGLVTVLQLLMKGVLHGFSFNESICEELLQISPIVQIIYKANGYYGSFVDNYLFIDIIISIFALVMGYFVYKYRDLESAGDVVSGKYIKILFKYGVTACTMLVGALYIKEIFSLQSVNIFVYLLFALLGYAIAEMLIRKSFRIWDSYKGFLVFTVVFVIIALGIKADMFGYERYVPDIKGIKAVSLYYKADFANSTLESPAFGVLYSDENIENFVNLHRKIIENKQRNLDNPCDSIYIKYELIDGRIISREYELDEAEYKDVINKIYDSTEYKMATNAIFDYDVDDIYSVAVSNIISGYSYTSMNREDIIELYEVTKQDILNMDTDKENEYRPIFMVDFTIRNNKKEQERGYTVESENARFVSETFNINAEKLKEFMEKRGYTEGVTDISTVKCIVLSGRDYETDLEITDPEKIGKVLTELYRTEKINYDYDRNVSILVVNNDDQYSLEIDKEKDADIIEMFK